MNPTPTNLLELIAIISAEENLFMPLETLEEYDRKIKRGDFEIPRLFVIAHGLGRRIKWSDGSVGPNPKSGCQAHA